MIAEASTWRQQRRLWESRRTATGTRPTRRFVTGWRSVTTYPRTHNDKRCHATTAGKTANLRHLPLLPRLIVCFGPKGSIVSDTAPEFGGTIYPVQTASRSGVAWAVEKSAIEDGLVYPGFVPPAGR